MSGAIAKGGLILIVILVGSVIALTNAEKKLNFACKGIATLDGVEMPTEFSLRIERVRWYIMWGDGDGSVWLETEEGLLHFFTYFEDDGLYWHFAREKFLQPPFGLFSTTSNKATIGMRDGYVIEGHCKTAPLYD